VVLTICRAILHDPARYPEPDAFKPERFLNPDGSLLDDPVLVLAFGYGKRVCPGRHLVDATLFITVASLLSVFNIEKGETPRGQPFEYTYTGSVIRFADQNQIVSKLTWYFSRPNSFPCSIVPRDKRAEELIIADTIAR
jgi:cytochrome P450